MPATRATGIAFRRWSGSCRWVNNSPALPQGLALPSCSFVKGWGPEPHRPRGRHRSTAFPLGRGLESNVGSWVTDGTATGTYEVTINGAYSTGVHAADLTVFNAEVLFEGIDAAGLNGLWVYDGQNAYEVTGIAGTFRPGLDPVPGPPGALPGVSYHNARRRARSAWAGRATQCPAQGPGAHGPAARYLRRPAPRPA
jgi:hypothetical protein